MDKSGELRQVMNTEYFVKAMNPSKNDFLVKDENDEGDSCHQTCTFIGHRVCNPSLMSRHQHSLAMAQKI